VIDRSSAALAASVASGGTPAPNGTLSSRYDRAVDRQPGGRLHHSDNQGGKDQAEARQETSQEEIAVQSQRRLGASLIATRVLQPASCRRPRDLAL
jgi:hypothetical protein